MTGTMSDIRFIITVTNGDYNSNSIAITTLTIHLLYGQSVHSFMSNII